MEPSDSEIDKHYRDWKLDSEIHIPRINAIYLYPTSYRIRFVLESFSSACFGNMFLPWVTRFRRRRKVRKNVCLFSPLFPATSGKGFFLVKMVSPPPGVKHSCFKKNALKAMTDVSSQSISQQTLSTKAAKASQKGTSSSRRETTC